MTAGEYARAALSRSAGLLIVRPGDLHEADARLADRHDFLLPRFEELPLALDLFGRRVRPRLEHFRRRRRTLRRVRPVVLRRQALVHPGHGRGHPVAARRHVELEVERLAREVLAIGEERRAAIRIERAMPHFHAVHPQGHFERFRSGRTQPAQRHLEGVVAVHRELMRRVQRVRQRKTRLVVLEQRLRAFRNLPLARIQPRQRRLRDLGAVERRADHLVGGSDVALHQHRRQRQHVADVVEAVAAVVLRELVGWTDVDGEQVADAVVVFGAVQAARGDAAGIDRRRFVRLRDFTIDPLGDGLDRRLVGLGLVLGRHLAGLELADDLVPLVGVLQHGGVGLILLEAEAALLLLVAVTSQAVFLDERFDELFEVGGAGLGARRHRRVRGRQWRVRRLGRGVRLLLVRRDEPRAFSGRLRLT